MLDKSNQLLRSVLTDNVIYIKMSEQEISAQITALGELKCDMPNQARRSQPW